MDGGVLEEAVGAKLICNPATRHFWNGGVLNYPHLYDEANICQKTPTEISGIDVPDAAELSFREQLFRKNECQWRRLSIIRL